MTPLTPPASSPPTAPESPTLGGSQRKRISRPVEARVFQQLPSSQLTPPRDRHRHRHPVLRSDDEAAASTCRTDATEPDDALEDVLLIHTEYAPRGIVPARELTRALVASLAARHVPRLLVTSVSQSFFNRIRSTLLRSNLKYSYSGDTGTLSLQRMPESAIHAALGIFASQMKCDMLVEGFLTKEEGRMLECAILPWKLPSGKFKPGPGKAKLKKREASDKVPDMAYFMTDATFASVIWECGWSEDYDDLVSDARQWLEKGGGDTKMVVIAKISGDRQAQKRLLTERREELMEEERKRREEKRKRVEQNQKRGHGAQNTKQDEDLEMSDIVPDDFGWETAPDEADDPDTDTPSETEPDASFSSNSSDRSTPSDYRALHTLAHQDHSLWQAPITCFLEIWALEPSTMTAYKHGPTYDVYPNHSTVNPKITRADVLPHIVNDAPFTASPVAPDMGVEFELKLDVFKARLEAGIRRQAFTLMARERKRARGGRAGESHDEWVEGGAF